MARTTLVKTTAPGSYSHAGAALTLTAGDAVNGNQFAMSGGEYVIARNSGASSRTLTLQSAPDQFNRERDVAETLTAGQVKVFGPFMPNGWKQSDGYFYLDPDHADLLLGVISPPF